jgi:hypothetical protein
LEAECVLGVVEECGQFSFRGLGHNIFEDDTGVLYGSISRDRCVLLVGAAEIENTAYSRLGFGLGEIQGIAVDGENQWAGGVAHCGGVGTGVIEALIYVFECFGGRFGLCRGEGSESYEVGAIDCLGKYRKVPTIC